MNDANTRTKSDRGLAEPALKGRTRRFVYHDARRERLRSKREIIANTHCATDVFDVATECARCHIQGVAKEEATRIHVWILTKIERVAESDGVDLIFFWPKQDTRPDL